MVSIFHYLSSSFLFFVFGLARPVRWYFKPKGLTFLYFIMSLLFCIRSFSIFQAKRFDLFVFYHEFVVLYTNLFDFSWVVCCYIAAQKQSKSFYLFVHKCCLLFVFGLARHV
ncbi:hypothetical protein AAZX31_05G084900 [Glycine max]